ncbi:hypothetical protein LCGC14_2532520, partial [marine sediment metagenome]
GMVGSELDTTTPLSIVNTTRTTFVGLPRTVEVIVLRIGAYRYLRSRKTKVRYRKRKHLQSKPELIRPAHLIVSRNERNDIKLIGCPQ